LLDFWRRRYRFILIDSTSGVNDMGGLCAMMIPDKLVAVFTPSRQSLLGVLDVARCAADYRQGTEPSRRWRFFRCPRKSKRLSRSCGMIGASEPQQATRKATSAI